MKKILEFNTKFKQLGEGCCGPNAIKHILINKYELNIPEERLINISNCSQRNGASVKGILKVADNFKLNYSIKHNSSIQDLVDSVINNNLGILLIQAWPSKKVFDWSNINYSGHYIDFFGFDTLEEKIFYYDPFDGKKKNISYKKLDKIWHDKDPKNKIYYDHFGIFFR
jgi:Peptidase C39 family